MYILFEYVIIIYYSMLYMALIMALSGQLASDFTPLNDSLFDIMSVCSYTQWLRPCGSALAMVVSRTADSIYSSVNVAYWEAAVKIM